MKVYGQLEKAQLELLAADPTGVNGRLYYNTGTNQVRLYQNGVWTSVADISSSQILTNKDIDGGTASNTSRITIPKATYATLLGLTRKQGTLVYASDLNKLYQDTGTSLVEVGSGSSGAKNYIANPKFNDGVTTSWSLNTLTVDATTKAVSGNVTTGAASITTFAASATTPLEGAFSLSVGGTIAAGAAFLSDAFAIDREDQAKVQSFSFAYEAVSGTMNFSGTSSNTWAVWIAEVTTATPNTVVSWIQPAGVYNLVQSSGGVGIATGTFQTTATGTAYRLAVVCINAAGVATSMRFDDFKLGPQVQAMAPAMSDWQSYTPTTNITGGGTTTSGFWKRVGDSINIDAKITFTGAPTIPGSPNISIPSGLTIDTAKLTQLGNNQSLGLVSILAGGATYEGQLFHTGATNTFILNVTTVGGTYASRSDISATIPGTFGNGDFIQIRAYNVPISGWSSNTVSSSDTDTRVIASSARKSGNQSISAAGNVLVTFGVVDFDNSGSFASSRFTAPVSGVYAIDANLSINATAAGQSADAIIYLNGSEYTRSRITFGSSGVSSVFVAKNIVMKAGDYVEIFSGASTTLNIDGTNNGGWNYFNVRRLSGPAVVQASESVNASYYTANVALTANAIIDFSVKDYDSHSAVTTGASWKFTAPTSGVYSLSGFAGLTTATANDLVLYKNGSQYRRICRIEAANGEGVISGSIKLLAGDYVDVRANNTAGTTAGGGQFYMAIARIGN